MTPDGQSIREQGINAFRAGKVEDAIRLLNQAVGEDPRDYGAHAVLGAALVQRGDYARAVDAFERARSIRPDLAHIHYNLGLALQKAGRAQEAVAAFRAALEVDPSYEKAKDALDRAAAAQTVRQVSAPGPPAEAPPGPARMPTAPAPLGAQPPPAPWEVSASAAPPRPQEDTLQLRRLDGGPEARQAPKEQPKAEPGEPPSAPWEMGQPPVQRVARPAPSAPRQAPPPRPGLPTRPAKQADEGQFALSGALAGAMWGAIFMVVLLLLDHFLGSRWGVIAKAARPGLVVLAIGGVISGAVLGAIIGIPTAVTGNATPGICTSIGLWVFVALVLLLREGASGIALLLGLGMAAVYGVAMGFIVAGQVNSSVRRA